MNSFIVAIVGCGSQGCAHAEAYQKAGCQVKYCCDPNAERSVPLARQMGDAYAISDYMNICDGEFDVVSIASPDFDHDEYVVRGVAYGKHVFCEKPLTVNQNALGILRSHTEASTCLLGCNFPLPLAPAFRYLLDHKSDLGIIYAMDLEYAYGRLEKLTGNHWRNRSDYSVMLGGGIHLIDLLLQLVDERPKCVRAIGNSICLDNDPITEDSEVLYDYVTATLCFPSTLIARVTANFGNVTSHHHRVVVYGTKGTAIIDDQGLRFCFERDSPHAAFTPSALSTIPPQDGLIPLFVDAVLGKTEWTQTQRVFDGLSIAFAIDESLKTGERKVVEYV